MFNVWPFNIGNIAAFDRDEWPHWIDADDDGEDTRQEILERDSLIPVTRSGDRISTGLWVCLYTGRVVRDAGRIDVDHIVALKEAHNFGGFEWDIDKRRQLANDPENLLSVYRSANRAKSATNSYEGMPPNIAHWSRYLILREQIIHKYGLTQSDAELNAVAFYSKKWVTHQHWIKMGRVRRFMSRWVPGIFRSCPPYSLFCCTTTVNQKHQLRSMFRDKRATYSFKSWVLR